MASRRQLIRDFCLTALVIALVPALLLGILLSKMMFVALIVVAAYIVVLIDELRAYHVIETRLRRGRFRPYKVAVKAGSSDVLSRVADRQHANLMVYGGFSPFVGSGTVLGGWSFTVNVQRGKKRPDGSGRLDPVPFRCRELYGHVARAVKGLELDGVTVEERLYVNGRGIRDDRRFLPDQFGQPCPRVDPFILDWFVENPTSSARHYQCIQTVASRGHLVLSFLVRFQKTGIHLFVETTMLLVTPIHPRYRRIDRLDSMPVWERLIELLPEAALRMLERTPMAPLRVVHRVRRTTSRLLQRQQHMNRINVSPSYNYGADRSLRELASSDKYSHYFQRLDKEMYQKIIQAELFEAILRFLDERQVDTTAFKKRESAILNNGLIVTGGQLQAGNVAVGEGASILEKLGLGGHKEDHAAPEPAPEPSSF